MSDSVTTIIRRSPCESHARRSAHETALIVEDHCDSREFLRTFLEGLGYAVLEAEEGNQALDIAFSHPLNLILTDLCLPVIDGIEFVREVRKLRHDLRSVKIVMLSAYDRKEYVESALQAGCDVVLAKPVDLDKLEWILNSFQSPPDSYHQELAH